MDKAARGSWQRECLRLMQTGYGCPSAQYNLRGKARTYSLHYVASFRSLLARLSAAGISVQRIPGPQGGEYAARYYIVIA